MVDINKAKILFKKLQEFDNDLCDLILSEDGTKKILSGYSKVENLQTIHQKYIDICRESLKHAQICLKEIIYGLKTNDNK